MMEQHPDGEEYDLTIRALRAGVPEALRDYFFQYYKEVYGLALLLLNEAFVAQKIAMDAFWLLWERRADFRKYEQVRVFVAMAARNKSLHYWQHRAPLAANIGDMRITASGYGIPEDILQELFAFAAVTSAVE